MAPPAEAPAEHARSANAAASLLDLALLNQHREALGHDGLTRLLEQFRDQHRQHLTTLSQTKEPRQRARTVHQLAGTLANLGFKAAAAECRALLPPGNAAPDHGSLTHLEATIDASLAALKPELGMRLCDARYISS